MTSTTLVDFCLLIGIATSARRLGIKFEPRSLHFWGLGLAGAFTFEAVNFQMTQAFIEAFRVNGAGLYGVLFPILVGVMFPLPMLLCIRLAGQFRVVLVVFVLTIVLQLAGITIAAAGFTILRPVSVIEEFVRLNPESEIATVDQFVSRMGFSGWVGLLHTWSLLLSALPLGLVSLLDRWSWARRHPIVAAPVYAASLVAISFFWFKQMPVMRDYSMTWQDAFLGGSFSAGLGSALGMLGLKLAHLAPDGSREPGLVQ